MKVQVKLYAALAQYLPPQAADNVAELDLDPGATPASVLAGLGVPAKMCHLVLVNGVYVEPSLRDAQVLAEGDALAVWPPVAGG